MNSQLSILSDPNCKNPGPELPTQSWIDNQPLIQFLTKLIPILEEKCLIGLILPCSTITALARNHKSRLPSQFKAVELADWILRLDPIVVAGVWVRAWVITDSESGRSTNYIQFLQTTDYNNLFPPNCKNSAQLEQDKERDRLKQERAMDRLLERKRQDQFERISEASKGQTKLSGLKLIEYEQKEALKRMMQDPNRQTEHEFYVEDAGLIEHIRALMLEAQQLKDKPAQTKDTVIKNGI